MTIRAIEITFSQDVDLDNSDLQELHEILLRICKRYEAGHPGRVMWPAGYGQKMLTNPFMHSDDEPLEFDEKVYSVEIAEREDFAWPCAKCGRRQDDHVHHRMPVAEFYCDFEPKPREPRPEPEARQPQSGEEARVQLLDRCDYLEAGMDEGTKVTNGIVYDLIRMIRAAALPFRWPRDMRGRSDPEAAWEFWKSIVMPQGNLDIEQVKRELSDYSFLLDEVPKWLCHATGDLLSKPHYFAEGVISAIDDYTERMTDEAVKEAIEPFAGIVAAAKELPDGSWYLDDNKPHRVMLETPERWHHAVAEDEQPVLVQYRTDHNGDGEPRHLRAIVAVLNAAAGLVPADGEGDGE